MKKKKLYDGKNKKIYATDFDDQIVLEFKDNIGVSKQGKRQTLKGKGALDNQISSFLFKYLDSFHIPTHFIKELSDREMLVKKVEMIPIKIVVRNIAAGTLVKQFNVEEGTELECPIIEYYLKEDEQQGSMVNVDHIVTFGHATSEEIILIKKFASKINAILKDYFRRRSLSLVDVTLNFGRLKGKIVLADEISTNTCSLVNLKTGDKLDLKTLAKNPKSSAEKYEVIRQHIFRTE